MTNEIKTVAICGASGNMGASIAIVAARAGFRTIAYDLFDDGLARALSQTAGFFEKSVARGKMTEEERDAALARIENTSNLDDLAEADLVIEAVFEQLDIKQGLFTALNKICPEHTIFASNTSTLSITEIASGCGREDRVVGMHFCLPAQLMKLVEMTAGINTSPETFMLASGFAEKAGQIPAETKDRPGFVLNALLVPFNNDVIRAIDSELATPEDIDIALKTALGYKMGPCELLDMIGLDTQVRLCEAFFPITNDARAAAPPLLRRMVAAGRLGRKSGIGFFNYNTDAMFGG